MFARKSSSPTSAAAEASLPIEERLARALSRAEEAEQRAAAAEQRTDELSDIASRYRTLMANLPDTLVVAFDHDLRYRVVDGGGLENRHLFAHAEGKTLYELFEQEVAEVLAPMYRATLSGEHSENEVEHDGRAYLVQQRPIRAIDGTITGGLVLWRDITRLKQAEQALREERKALQVALSQRDILLQEVYHRVKNNLQVVYSLLSLQRRAMTDEGAKAALLTARERVAAMARLHERLYRTADLERLDFGDYLAGLVQELESSYRTASPPVVEVVACTLPLPLERAVPLGLLVHELVANALQHAWDEGATGKLVIRLEIEGENACLIIADNGKGMPPREKRRDGSLGLVLVESLVHQLGGTVDLHTGPGTRWTILFPV